MRIKKIKEQQLKFKILILLALILSLIKIFDTKTLDWNKNDRDIIPEISGSLGYTIHIDELIPTKDWDTTNSTYEWCSGAGTFSNPYIIKDVEIDGSKSGSCILIKNSDVYFRLENCTIYNSGAGIESGIKLLNVKNGEIKNSNCSKNNGYGIYLDNCNNISISQNLISNNKWHGILLESSVNCTLLFNSILNNQRGIYLRTSSIDNEIMGNIIKNHTSGIHLYQDCRSTIIRSNKIILNDYGLFLDYNCTLNTIFENTFEKNRDKGVKFEWYDNLEQRSRLNTFYGNQFIENNVSAFESRKDNQWNITNIGNYWDDYTGPDADDNGIGDTPYIAGNLTDYLPIWTDPPNVEIFSPVENQTFLYDPPVLNLSITDPNLNATWYSLDDGLTNHTLGANISSIAQWIWDPILPGNITIKIYANDTAGNIAYDEVFIYKILNTQVFYAWIIGVLIGVGVFCVIVVVRFKRSRLMKMKKSKTPLKSSKLVREYNPEIETLKE